MKLCLVFGCLEQEHFGKDVFLTPYYLARQYGCDLEIVYRQTATNKDFPAVYKGVLLHPIKMHSTYFWIWWLEWIIVSSIYIKKHAKDIDVLMSFHFFFRTVLHSYFYKRNNPNGKHYVKADVPDFVIEKLKRRQCNALWRFFYQKLIRNVDIFSIETSDCYNQILNLSYFKGYEKKVVYMPNGFDDEEAEELDVDINKFSIKENLIITVGRLGTKQKNTELLLSVLEEMNLKNWRVYLIGTVENSFKLKIEEFYKRNPMLKESVVFTGPIFDKKQLWSYYNRAKVFVLPSIWESYGLVLNEARYFKNYIVSTDVGAAKDVIDQKYGEIVGWDVQSWIDALQAIVNDEINIDKYQDLKQDDILWKNLVKRIQL